MGLTAKKVYAILKKKIGAMEEQTKHPIRYKGSVNSALELPGNPEIGDMYNISQKSIYGEAGMNVAWNGVVWDTMGAPIDMSLYFTKEEADATMQNMVNEYFEKNPVKPGATTEQAQQIDQNKTDIASLKVETNSLKEDISTKITKFYASNQGETHITDSDNGKIMDMMIYGKSSQDGTPTPENPVEIKSVVNPTVKVSNKDGTKSQTVTLPHTLNAIPVSSGGNVTIDGQQYIADYVDVERGKIVKCVEKYRISSGLKWMYEPSENDRFGAYGLNININPNFGGNTLFTHYQNKPNGTGGFISPGNIRLHNFQGFTDVTNFKEWLDKNESYAYFAKNTLEEIDLTIEEIQIFKALSTYYPATNISVNSEQLDGYTVFNYPISMANGWNYVKKQLNDNRDYIYDMDLQSAEAYVNSEYAVALTELEV